MTVKELRDKLEELVNDGYGEYDVIKGWPSDFSSEDFSAINAVEVCEQNDSVILEQKK
ncbi:MAG: hypothetical protein LKF81_07170 [Prevotella sp.]|jgi:hypothetical protein|nr:hypothetical protein [uncultured Prevotella sp.]MCH4241669.1 hypothetical protein [Prevotella sp.]